MSKYCPQCQQTHPLSNFSHHKSRADGHAAWCKSCTALYHRSAQGICSLRQARKRYKVRHPEKVAAAAKKRGASTILTRRKSRAKHAEKIRAYQAKYYEEHAAALREYQA